ncbi:hypothetical protein [Streptomyces sp. NPDC001591]|uniref:hypothetical protein n=1 Tax=Streptomyces sp. NPDC001591 TaxID=3364589 RepID=UPI0036B2FDD8
MATTREVMQQLDELLAARKEAARPLVELIATRAELRRQLTALDEPYGQAYSDAEAAGWTAEELMMIGAEEPAKRPKGRPRTRRAAVKKAAAEPTATPEASSPTPAVPDQKDTGSQAETSTGS